MDKMCFYLFSLSEPLRPSLKAAVFDNRSKQQFFAISNL